MSVVPSRFIDHLENVITDFNREPERIQLALARMLWMTLSPLRRHKHHKGAFDFSRADIRVLFGSGEKFKQINRDPLYRYFRVRRWNNSVAKKDNYNGGYEPTPWMQAALDSFLQTDSQSDLINHKGQIIRTPLGSISSIDKDRNPVKGWSSSDAPNLVRVDLSSLRQLEDHYRLLHDASINGLLPGTVDYVGDVKAINLVRQAAAIRHLASSNRFPGYLPHRYVQSTAGRLYTEGISLQNCSKVIRNAALQGHWDYDISCCHFAILAQMAAQFNCVCPAIMKYVSDKTQTRATIASEVGISIKQVKTVLTSTAYGAPASLHQDNSIPAAIGMEAAKRLYANRTYRAIKDEVTKAVMEIIRKHPVMRSGKFTNLFGKAISRTKKRSQIISHLLTGVEAVALRAAVRTCSDRVALLQHDGFVTTQQVNRDDIHQAVLEATGGKYRLSFEEEPIDCHLPDFSGASWIKELKLLEERKASIHAASSDVSCVAPVTVAAWAGLIPPVYPDPISEDAWPLPF